MVMNGTRMTMTGVMIGLVLLMIGQVTGRGPKMTGTGPMTGLGVLRIGGVLNSRVLAHCQDCKALHMPCRTLSGVSLPRTWPL